MVYSNLSDLVPPFNRVANPIQKPTILTDSDKPLFDVSRWTSFPPSFFGVNWPLTFSLLLVVCTTYLMAVRRRRFRAIRKLEERYGATPDRFKVINYKDAQNILANLFLLDTPWLFLTAKDFAFLRAFGITEIADLSVKAKKMVDDPGLRYSDTVVFATEWILNPLDSERAVLSINRVNFIHSRYRGIKDDQMVYTLCLLICEVFEWIDKYEWRASVPLERYASYVFWKEVGIRMGISEKIIPLTFEECAQLIKDYEKAEMHPSRNSALIAQGIVRLYQSTLPNFLRPLFANIFVYFMDTRLRAAVMTELDTTSWIVGTITTKLLPIALSLRAKFVRHCLLPRTTVPTIFVPTKNGERMHVIFWQMLPHYAPATFLNKWGPNALYRRVFGLALPGDKWISEGYKLEEVGYHGKGVEKVLEVMERAKQGGCPYSTYGRVQNEAELGGIFAEYADRVCPILQ
ncbi:hypothetical protein BDN70DRAFT_869998 [Pholiota conissans]|uniref:ER-bound oxygenase mpaB/mpaB'/Rubber oxygenase catalytic domain-containing protein n=1 Tax=Pholiota conissans TaxID=109636 RepID=A0A9P5ZFF2_9AGAR|nr:hypothetical protein BDN70DRAFT_869998 [Pholiota conissans]